MKPIPLRSFVAPSPSVLNFLRSQVRNAFELPGAQCAAFREQKRGFGTDGFGRCVHVPREPCRRLATARKGFIESRITIQEAAAFSLKSTRNASRTRNTIPSYRRNFSTTSFTNSWHIFGGSQRRQVAGLQTPPPPLDAMGDAPTPLGFESLGRMTRAANEYKMRCTELDEHGNVTMVSGEFKKSELIAKVCTCQLPD